MRRWFAILLLAVLPLQFTWAAAATYCQHESAPGTRHFGHHVHQHGDAAQKTGQGESPAGAQEKSSTGKLSADSDCGVCHLGSSNAFGTPVITIGALSADALHGAGVQAFSTRAPDHPERPNWRIA